MLGDETEVKDKMAEKRGSWGRGSVRPVKDRSGATVRNAWRVRCSWTDADGKRHQPSKIVHGSKREALRELERIERSFSAELNPNGGKTAFATFAGTWQKSRERSGDYEERTLAEGRQIIGTVSRYIGDVALKDFTAATIEGLYARIREDKARADGSTITGTTLRKYHCTLNMIFKKALDYDYILKNPMDRVEKPKATDPNRRALSLEDSRRLLSALLDETRRAATEYGDKERRLESWGKGGGRAKTNGLADVGYPLAALTALLTGMRLGEFLALTWGCVEIAGDMSAVWLRVSQSLTNTGHLKAPKTAAGRRSIPVTGTAYAKALLWWHDFQMAELRKIGALGENEEQGAGFPVFCSCTGTWPVSSNFEAWWRKWRDENGFPTLKLHELRHTQATQLLANGVDVETVATRLGHASSAITLAWYTHAVPEKQLQAAERVEELFSASA